MACAWSAPSHYLNQCRNIVNWTLRNTFQWHSNRNSNIVIQGNAFESVVCEMTSILSRPQCVKIELRLLENFLHVFDPLLLHQVVKSYKNVSALCFDEDYYLKWTGTLSNKRNPWYGPFPLELTLFPVNSLSCLTGYVWKLKTNSNSSRIKEHQIHIDVCWHFCHTRKISKNINHVA